MQLPHSPSEAPPAVNAASKNPLRETPFPDPIHGIATDPSHPPVPDEPVLDVDNIQGNVLAGFNKDFQTFLFYRIDNPAIFRQWLATFVPVVSTTAEALVFNRLFKALRRRQGEPRDRPATVKATWRNIAFTYSGLEKLQDEIPGLLSIDFTEPAFKEGMAKRAGSLGDRTGSDGDPVGWEFGDLDKPVDLVILVASDTNEDLEREVTYIEHHAVGAIKGVTRVSKQEGRNLPTADRSPNKKDLSGHEHFGFLDGVSQPGVRGRISVDPHDVLTPRQNPTNRDQGKPGQDLLWPGEFVFGYPGQDPEADSIAIPGPLPNPGPAWAANGSFLVFRRLNQNVAAFHSFLHDQADSLRIPAERLGAKLVGRWESGAPVSRTESNDIPDIGNDDCANNHFEFSEDSHPIPKAGLPNPFDCTDIQFPSAKEDLLGNACPFAGHIRKAYPRDDFMRFRSGTNGPVRVPADDDTFDEDLSVETSPVKEETTQSHRMLRRGIPFGEASASTFEIPIEDTPKEGRGLLFLAYQTSIEEQFEFVTKNWCNNPDFKDPNTGFDPIIGQNAGGDRTFKVRIDGTVHELTTAGLPEGKRDWVIATGGGYFFAPSIDALKMLAGL